MAKRFSVLAIGTTALLMASLIGCSQAPNSKDSAASTEKAATTTAGSSSTSQAGTSTKEEDEYRPVQNVTFPAPGPDPMAMVFQLRRPTGAPIRSEQIRVTYKKDQAVVTTSVGGLKTGLAKDVRTKYEFNPVKSADGKTLWQMVKVSEQNKCQSGHGPEDWSATPCK